MESYSIFFKSIAASAWISYPLLLSLALSTILFFKCSNKKGKVPPKSLRNQSQNNAKSNIKSIHPPPSQSNIISAHAKSKTKPTEDNMSKQSNMAGAAAAGGGGAGKSVVKNESKVKKTRTKDTEEKVPDEDYGDVAEPSPSAKKRREQQLEKEKKEKIQKGFYQSKSDEDDTLEPIKSLKQERTDEESTKKSSKKKAQKKQL